ncbi:MAG: ABC transporter ATP-binding protein [Cyclobacteriaceae bacterium]|nr:ABC transporter ATP-binding protein [Cyclobacteriaceae bacterium]
MSTAIKVESLSKKFTIGHKKSGDLRHAIGDKIRGLFKPDATEKEEFWALKDLNFEIKHGEAVGIIGRNGAGKSTLLKILSRITEPTKGRFEINGRVSSLLEVGTGFHPELSGRENIYLNGTILGMRKAEIKAKFDEILAFSGVEKFIDTPVKHYSSGMKVRLAFSVAAHLEPEILIIDEVLAVGDAEFQKRCLGKMEDVAGEGRTVIFVSHNLKAIEIICEKGLYLKSGICQGIGEIEEILCEYRIDTEDKLNVNDDGKYLFEIKNKWITLNEVILKSNDIKTSKIEQGSTFTLGLKIVKHKDLKLKIGFIIKELNQNPIIGINNLNIKNIYNSEDGNYYYFEIINFPIYKTGLYIIDVYIGDTSEDFIIIEDQVSFEVIENTKLLNPVKLQNNLNLIHVPNINFKNPNV